MDAMRMDVDWVDGYAKQVDQAVREINAVRDELRDQSLGGDVFGELGRTVGTADAYHDAVRLLTEQVDRAAQMLASASTGLGKATGHLAGHEDDALARIRQVRAL